MDQCEWHSQPIRDRSGSLRAAGVRADNHRLLVVRDVVLDVLLQQRAAVEVVDGDVEEALVLRVMQVHGDDVVSACAGEKVGDECAGLGDPLLVPGAGLETIFRGLRGGWAGLVLVRGDLGEGCGSGVLVRLGAVG